ncbi:MAG TPA: transcriptional regulator [Clostridiales bacterium]|nr:transcriptional regulator [Clostridiales bacterium]HCG36688.1 transcriptional regulator [Clostridiales bacterium]
MKLVMAIINNDDSQTVSNQLTKAGYHVTKMATTGGFLMSGNSTFITGVEDDHVDAIIDIIRNSSKRRKQTAPMNFASGPNTLGSYPLEVTVGGATIFVLNVERYERV